MASLSTEIQLKQRPGKQMLMKSQALGYPCVPSLWNCYFFLNNCLNSNVELFKKSIFASMFFMLFLLYSKAVQIETMIIIKALFLRLFTVLILA